MIVPEEYRCCVCLSPPERPLHTNCPHLVCAACAETGSLEACPVCRAAFPPERPTNEAFASALAKVVLTCECGKSVHVFDAETHLCDHTRKRKRSEEFSPQVSGRKAPVVPNRSTFKCPFCDERNLTPQALLEHVQGSHSPPSGRSTMSAICPICAAMPWGDPSYVTRDIVSHLKLRHRCDYTVLTDFEADEEAMFERAMRESMKSAGFEAEVEEDERILAEVLRMSAQETVSTEAGHSSDTMDTGDGSSDSGSSSRGRRSSSSSQASFDCGAGRGEGVAREAGPPHSSRRRRSHERAVQGRRRNFEAGEMELVSQ